MIDGSPSQTALMAAAMRANHGSFASEPKILRDNLAVALDGFVSEEALKVHINLAKRCSSG